jgi:hypothetical protein
VPLDVASAVVVGDTTAVTVRVAKDDKVEDTEGRVEVDRVAREDSVMLPPGESVGVPDCTPVQVPEEVMVAATEEDADPLANMVWDALPVPPADPVPLEVCDGVADFSVEGVEVDELLRVTPPTPPPLGVAFKVLETLRDKDPAGEGVPMALAKEVGEGVTPREGVMVGDPVPTLRRGEELEEGPLSEAVLDTEVVGMAVKEAVKDVAREAAGLAVEVPELPMEEEALRVSAGEADLAEEAELVMVEDSESSPELESLEEGV